MSKSNKILFATSIASFDHGKKMDKLLGMALKIRGHEIDYLFCDSALEHCQVIKYQNYKPNELIGRIDTPRCASCIKKIFDKDLESFSNVYTYSNFLKLDKELESYYQLIKNASLEQLLNFKVKNIFIGDQIRAGIVRYFANTKFENEEYVTEIAQRVTTSAVRTYNIFYNYILKHRPDVIVAHHGIYIPQGVIALVAKELNVRLVTWNPSYRKGTFIFSHFESYHYSMLIEPIQRWENIKLNDLDRKKLLTYMDSRENGGMDWIKFTDTMPKLSKTYELFYSFLKIFSFKKKYHYTFALLTNVSWDADLHFSQRVFPSMEEWIIQTIRFFIRNPNLGLIIRIHPAEISGNVKSRQLVMDIIRKEFPIIPDNIRIIDSNNSANTYDLVKKCDAVIIYGTKAGIEFAFRGMPVIVCGESWIRGKKIGIDIHSISHYFQELLRISNEKKTKISTEQRELAEKYAFHFFFRRMIFLPWIKLDRYKKVNFELSFESMQELAEGKNGNLDVICDGITLGTPFEAINIEN